MTKICGRNGCQQELYRTRSYNGEEEWMCPCCYDGAESFCDHVRDAAGRRRRVVRP